VDHTTYGCQIHSCRDCYGPHVTKQGGLGAEQDRKERELMRRIGEEGRERGERKGEKMVREGDTKGRE